METRHPGAEINSLNYWLAMANAILQGDTFLDQQPER